MKTKDFNGFNEIEQVYGEERINTVTFRNELTLTSAEEWLRNKGYTIVENVPYFNKLEKNYKKVFSVKNGLNVIGFISAE